LLYVPQSKAVTCACEKCGSTSVLEYVYKETFGKQWKDERCDGFDVHNVDANCWNKMFESAEWYGPEVFADSRSLAVIRDPKERLVSSWKSKYACSGEKYGQDNREMNYRSRRVNLLREHSGTNHPGCMSLHEFAKALQAVKLNGNLTRLDQHIVPQSMWCFAIHKPEEFGEVLSLSDEGAYDKLAKHFRFKGKANNEHDHESADTVLIDPDTARVLDEVTEEDYKLLGKYLTRPSRAVAGAEV
jgi:hypothetical protein